MVPFVMVMLPIVPFIMVVFIMASSVVWPSRRVLPAKAGLATSATTATSTARCLVKAILRVCVFV